MSLLEGESDILVGISTEGGEPSLLDRILDWMFASDAR
jgi:hypothetical protein